MSTTVRDIAREFALGELLDEPTLVAKGANGLVWKVTSDVGVFAFKQLQEWVDAPPVPFDIEVQRSAARADIPLPLPVMTPAGLAVVKRARVYEWVDLGPPMTLPVTVPWRRPSATYSVEFTLSICRLPAGHWTIGIRRRRPSKSGSP